MTRVFFHFKRAFLPSDAQRRWVEEIEEEKKNVLGLLRGLEHPTIAEGNCDPIGILHVIQKIY